MVFLRLELERLLKLIFNLVLAGFKLLNLGPDQKLLRRNLLMQLLYSVFLVVCASLLIDTGVAGISSTLQLDEKLVFFADDVVHFALLGQDFIAKGQQACVTLSADKTTTRVAILDLVHHEATIFTCREEPVVVETEAHTLDRSTVCLHFTQFFHRELPDLHGTWMASLTNTSKEGFTVCKDLDLRNVVLGVATVVMVIRVPHLALIAGHQTTIDRSGNICNSRD